MLQTFPFEGWPSSSEHGSRLMLFRAALVAAVASTRPRYFFGVVSSKARVWRNTRVSPTQVGTRNRSSPPILLRYNPFTNLEMRRWLQL